MSASGTYCPTTSFAWGVAWAQDAFQNPADYVLFNFSWALVIHQLNVGNFLVLGQEILLQFIMYVPFLTSPMP